MADHEQPVGRGGVLTLAQVSEYRPTYCDGCRVVELTPMYQPMCDPKLHPKLVTGNPLLVIIFGKVSQQAPVRGDAHDKSVVGGRMGGYYVNHDKWPKS